MLCDKIIFVDEDEKVREERYVKRTGKSRDDFRSRNRVQSEYLSRNIKTIRDKFPEANISPVDYDPGASETNQTNRIKLLMTVAKDNLKVLENEKKRINEENVSNREKELSKSSLNY